MVRHAPTTTTIATGKKLGKCLNVILLTGKGRKPFCTVFVGLEFGKVLLSEQHGHIIEFLG
jgi:hypothetical protein